MKVALDQIVMDERGRTDLGDIDGLAKSIDQVGLLHPVVVTADLGLVAGQRRIVAVRQLGWTEVDVTVVDLDNAGDVLQAELDENTCRRELSAYEADVIRQRREEALRPKAAGAKREAGKHHGKGHPKASSNLDEASATARATRKVAAIGTGYSGSTLDKVRKIRDAGERGVVKRGGEEVPVPAPVREVAEQAVEDVKQTGAAIEKSYDRVSRALDQYIEDDPEIARLKRMQTFERALRATRAFREYDFSLLTKDCEPQDWDALDTSIDALERATAAYRQAKPPRDLRALKGGRGT